MVLGALIWAAGLYALIRFGGTRLLVGFAVTVVFLLIIGFIAYVFARSAVVAHLKGNGIEVSETQFPELNNQLTQCCQALAIGTRPSAYILNGNGVLNAFATWFLGRQYVVLLSSVVDAMDENSNGIRFYLGHELAHVLRHDNPLLWALRWPALRFPLIGAAFSRARETTCDLHGLACSDSGEGAARSLAALSAGERRWKGVSFEALSLQLKAASGFWMSFHELTASYPWHAKRVMRVLHEQPDIPGRNPFAYVLAAFVPYAGKLGSGLGVLLYVYVIGMLAAIAIPAYQDYTVRADLTASVNSSQRARDALVSYYLANKQVPESLSVAGIDQSAPNAATMSLNPKGMVLTVTSKGHSLVFTPKQDGQGSITWTCSGGLGVSRPAQLPPACRQPLQH
jgi:Zn-dependent protease with chaperone function/type II secretory pathway pseudopilin PulG